MVYKVIGLMSGSSLDGLDIAYVSLQETGGKWSYEFLQTECAPYTTDWIYQLKNAIKLSGLDYQLLHTAYGHYIGKEINRFIDQKGIHHQVHLAASHGHTTFHVPKLLMTGQIGDGAAIAAETGLPVVSDLRAMDIAFGGQGAPIVPIGEKLLLGEYDYFLNLGGIANISCNLPGNYIAFDVCPANRVLNLIVSKLGKAYDDGGKIAATGKINVKLLNELNDLHYYKLPYPKSLANDFGTDVVFSHIQQARLSAEDALATFVEHIAFQISISVADLKQPAAERKLLATGGGALNLFLIERLQNLLQQQQVTVVVPDRQLIEFKEALVMALMGVLRWREEYNVLASVTGARRNSIGGALWLGTEA